MQDLIALDGYGFSSPGLIALSGYGTSGGAIILPTGAGEVITVQSSRRIVYLREENSRVVYIRFGE